MENRPHREKFKIYKESFEGLAERMIELKAEHDADGVESRKIYSPEPPYFEVLNSSKANPTEDKLQFKTSGAIVKKYI